MSGKARAIECAGTEDRKAQNRHSFKRDEKLDMGRVMPGEKHGAESELTMPHTVRWNEPS